VESKQLTPDLALLGERILGRWADIRREVRSVMEQNDIHKIEGMPYEEHRERVLKSLQLLVDKGVTQHGFPKEVGGSGSPGASLSTFEELVFADPSLQIKYGVQWGLFGSAILYLGTEYHHKNFLPGAVDLTTPGAFAMSETGHGSDVASLGTTATYDPETQEFSHSHTRSSQLERLVGKCGKARKGSRSFRSADNRW